MAMEQQAHNAVNGAEQAAKLSAEKVSRVAHDTVETVREYSERAEEQLREVSERSRELIDKVSDYIEAHPAAALGIAAAVGFVLGALAGRSSASPETENS